MIQDRQYILHTIRRHLYSRASMLMDYGVGAFFETVSNDINNELRKEEEDAIHNVIRDPDEE